MSTYKILIVEDSSTKRELIAYAISRIGGVSIAQAADGVEGLKKLSQQRFDLILTDINMPVMDGLTFIDNVRANEAWDKTPIIVITTEGAESMTKEAVKKGANNLVKKPFTPEQIKEKLASYFV
jgi:two-component system, chemotaxis family, chemotaxis protein CheY